MESGSVMEERLRFVNRLIDGESMSDVCREFGISRKTGYKISSRYREQGLFALTERSRWPVRYAPPGCACDAPDSANERRAESKPRSL